MKCNSHGTFVDTTWPRRPRRPNHPLWFEDGGWRCPHADDRVARRGEPGHAAKSLRGRYRGYTSGMKTAVSIPDEVFEKVERLARRARRSRSEVFSAALREYVARHAPDEVTEAIDRVCAAVNEEPDAFVAAASRRVLERTEW